MFWSIYNYIRVGFSLPVFLSLIFMLNSTPVMAEGSFSIGDTDDNILQTDQEQGTYNDRTTKGFDPSTITCTDSNGNGWIDQGECSWGDTSSPWFADSNFDTQYGNSLIPGGSSASMGQTANMTIGEPHFTMRFFNAPSAPNTTYTSGTTSNPSGSLRDQHNEFGFEVVVDKKTDPLEPYYMRFYVPYTTVESTQTDTTGDMTGDATGIYSREVTEMDPNNPGVFNRYVITGTYTSNGSNYTSGSDCETGCTYYDPQWP